MPYTPRTIAYHTDLVHPPAAPDPAPIQRVHNRLFASSSPGYRNFHVTPQGAVLANPQTAPGASSQVAFLADRVRFVEEASGLTVDEFSARVARILALVSEERPFALFAAQQVTLRTLINPRHHAGGFDYLREGLLRFGTELEAFGRPPQALGLRLVFPMQSESPVAFQVRVESLPNDPRSLFVECQGTFGPISPANHGLEPVERNIHTTYEFATGECLAFLERFDQPAT
jgi:hypothetical protein